MINKIIEYRIVPAFTRYQSDEFGNGYWNPIFNIIRVTQHSDRGGSTIFENIIASANTMSDAERYVTHIKTPEKVIKFDE